MCSTGFTRVLFHSYRFYLYARDRDLPSSHLEFRLLLPVVFTTKELNPRIVAQQLVQLCHVRYKYSYQNSHTMVQIPCTPGLAAGVSHSEL